MELLWQVLNRRGWDVAEKKRVGLHLPADFLQRYPSLVPEHLQFLERVELCAHPAGDAWFLTEFDYCGTSDSAFAWNEFELQSLEAAADDEGWRGEIVSFWDNHLPIATSVRSGYSYLALVMSGVRSGVVVRGREPEYEDVVVVAPSFASLVTLLSGEDRSPIVDFI